MNETICTTEQVEAASLIQGTCSEILSEAQYIQLAKVYASVFAAEPWCEVGRCFACGTFYPNKGSTCPQDGNDITDAYPVDWTVDYIQKELSKQGAFFILTTCDDQILSFGWGYSASILEIVTSKYSQDETFQNEIARCLKSALNP